MDVFKFIDGYNAGVAVAITVLTAILGPHWYLFAIFLVLNVIDWLTGWYRSRKLKQASSKIGFKGIVKKLGYWAIIAIAFMVAYAFVKLGNELLHIDLNFLSMIGWFTLACLIVNEIRSTLENLVECGYDVPKILIKGLAVADKMINKEVDGQMPAEEKTKEEDA